MKKTNLLVGGALLLASLFTTGCKEFMSNLDEPVSSYLSVSDTSVVLNLDTVYQIKANSINSDKAITYKCSDESIATVDANGLVTPVGNKEGDVVITVSVAASDNYNAGEQKVKIAVKQPLTFEALEDGYIDLQFYGVVLPKPIIVTTNRTSKKEYGNYKSGYIVHNYIDVKKGDKLQFESANDHTSTGWLSVRLQPRSKCAVYGNVMSMISPDGKYHTTKTIAQPYALAYLLLNEIYDGTNWIAGPTFSHEKYELMVPATKLTDGCYYGMFSHTALTEAPKLPAENMESSCYSDMFAGCTSLTKAPALPAKKLASRCYNYMFGGCTALTEAPELKAETLADNCYNSMFSGCSKLNKVVCLATTNATDALGNWLNGAGTDASVTKRTLVRAESNKKWTNNDDWTWGTANWYVPTSWTIEPPIPVENIRVKTYTDGAFPYWSLNNCVTSVINGAAHYVPTGSWNQFVCLPGSENPLAAGDYVFIFDIESNKDLYADEVRFEIRTGWTPDANVVSANVPIKAGRHTYRVGLPGVTGGNYDCYFTPGTADATLDLYSVSVNKVVE